MASILGDPVAVSQATQSKPSSKIGVNRSLQEFAKQPLGYDSLPTSSTTHLKACLRLATILSSRSVSVKIQMKFRNLAC